MNLINKLLKYGFVKSSRFKYIYISFFLNEELFKKEEIKDLLYKYLNVGKARSLMIEFDSIKSVIKTSKYIYLSTNNEQIYKIKI